MLTRTLAALAAAITLLTVPASSLPAASPAAAVTSAAGSPTSVVHVRPLDAAGRLKPAYRVVAQHGRASCLLGGIADGRAYRCFAGNGIYDPCWRESSTSTYLDCLVLPWRHAVVRLHATKGVEDSAGTYRSTRPWAVELRSGLRCVGVQGAAGAVDGRGISFTCRRSTTVLVGAVHRDRPAWRVRTATSTDGGAHYTTGPVRRIRTAWVGRASLHS